MFDREHHAVLVEVVCVGLYLAAAAGSFSALTHVVDSGQARVLMASGWTAAWMLCTCWLVMGKTPLIWRLTECGIGVAVIAGASYLQHRRHLTDPFDFEYTLQPTLLAILAVLPGWYVTKMCGLRLSAGPQLPVTTTARFHFPLWHLMIATVYVAALSACLRWQLNPGERTWEAVGYFEVALSIAGLMVPAIIFGPPAAWVWCGGVLLLLTLMAPRGTDVDDLGMQLLVAVLLLPARLLASVRFVRVERLPEALGFLHRE